MRVVSRGVLGFGCCLVLAFMAGAASAQQATFTDWQDSSGVVMRPLGGPIPDWSVTVGGGIAVTPAYEGSNQARLEPAPDFDIRYKDLAYASMGEGIGYNVLRGANYRAGIGLTYDIGREHSAPVGLFGLINTMARVRGVSLRTISASSGCQASSSFRS